MGLKIMSLNKRLIYLWLRNIAIAFGCIAALFACGFTLLLLNTYFGTPLLSLSIIGVAALCYIVGMAYSVAKSQYNIEQRRGEQVMNTLKRESF